MSVCVGKCENSTLIRGHVILAKKYACVISLRRELCTPGMSQHAPLFPCCEAALSFRLSLCRFLPFPCQLVVWCRLVCVYLAGNWWEFYSGCQANIRPVNLSLMLFDTVVPIQRILQPLSSYQIVCCRLISNTSSIPLCHGE